MGTILLKLLLQAGTPLLMSFVKAGVTALYNRKDNTLGLDANTIHMILDSVNQVTVDGVVTNTPVGAK